MYLQDIEYLDVDVDLAGYVQCRTVVNSALSLRSL